MPAESVVSRNAETLADSSRTPQAADSSGWYVVPMEVEPTVVETAAPVARPRGHVKCDQCGLVANHRTMMRPEGAGPTDPKVCMDCAVRRVGLASTCRPTRHVTLGRAGSL